MFLQGLVGILNECYRSGYKEHNRGRRRQDEEQTDEFLASKECDEVFMITETLWNIGSFYYFILLFFSFFVFMAILINLLYRQRGCPN